MDTVRSYSKAAQLGQRMIEVDDYKRTYKDESELQKDCEAWLRKEGIWFFHIPASAYRERKAGHALLGIPDLLVFVPNKQDKFNRSVLFELKSAKGKTRTGQERVGRKVNVFVIRSFAAFVDIMKEFLKT